MWKYAEDIIEFIAGYREISGKLLQPWERIPSPLSLARYDVQILDSLALQTVDNSRAYTQKQSELALKIIHKYRKQLNKLGLIIDEDVKELKFKFGIRFVDQSKTICLKDGKIQVKFPYNTEWINNIKSIATNGYGKVEFDHENKIWNLGLTEYIVNYIVTFGNLHQFSIDPTLISAAEKIVEMETIPYKIELTQVDGQLIVSNAPESLLHYLKENVGELSINNLYKLVDYSSVLQYTVDQQLINLLAQSVSENELELLTKRKLEAQSSEQKIENIIKYAEKTDRLPVYVYDTGTPKKDTEKIVYLNTKKTSKFIVKIKLMVSMTNVLVGYKKQDWIRRAEKVIFLK
jgi:hypothetical protein